MPGAQAAPGAELNGACGPAPDDTKHIDLAYAALTSHTEAPAGLRPAYTTSFDLAAETINFPLEPAHTRTSSTGAYHSLGADYSPEHKLVKVPFPALMGTSDTTRSSSLITPARE